MRENNAGSFDIKTLFYKYGMVFLLLVIIAVFSALSDTFFSMQNFGNILITQVTIGCVALGAMFILVVGEFDLSLGYLTSFCMVLGAKLAENGVNSALVLVLVMIAAGTLSGFINGIIAVKFSISSFIVTLSVGLTLSGLTQAVSGGMVLNHGIPRAISTFAQGRWGQIGYSVVFWLFLCLVVYFLLNHRPLGRKLYSVGSSEKASFLAGIKTNYVRIFAFSAAGFFTAIGAFLLLGKLGAASAAYGHSVLLPAYAIVFLSKISFKPGYFNIGGLILAILFVGIGSNGMTIVGAPPWASYIYEGVILVVAMLLANKLDQNKDKADE